MCQDPRARADGPGLGGPADGTCETQTPVPVRDADPPAGSGLQKHAPARNETGAGGGRASTASFTAALGRPAWGRLGNSGQR